MFSHRCCLVMCTKAQTKRSPTGKNPLVVLLQVFLKKDFIVSLLKTLCWLNRKKKQGRGSLCIIEVVVHMIVVLAIAGISVKAATGYFYSRSESCQTISTSP